jgi:hypothetical protein
MKNALVILVIMLFFTVSIWLPAGSIQTISYSHVQVDGANFTQAQTVNFISGAGILINGANATGKTNVTINATGGTGSPAVFLTFSPADASTTTLTHNFGTANHSWVCKDSTGKVFLPAEYTMGVNADTISISAVMTNAVCGAINVTSSATGYDLCVGNSGAAGAAYVCTLSNTTLATNRVILFVTDVTSTGNPPTLSIDGGGTTKNLRDLTANTVAGQYGVGAYFLRYSGTAWQGIQFPKVNCNTGLVATFGNGVETCKVDPAGPVGLWQKVTVDFTQLTTAGLTQTINLVSTAARTKLCGVSIKTTTAFSGGLIASLTVSVGDAAGTGTDYSAPPFTLFTASSDTNYQDTIPASKASVTSAASTITALFTSTLGNLNTATAGSVDIDVCTAVIP